MATFTLAVHVQPTVILTRWTHLYVLAQGNGTFSQCDAVVEVLGGLWQIDFPSPRVGADWRISSRLIRTTEEESRTVQGGSVAVDRWALSKTRNGPFVVLHFWSRWDLWPLSKYGFPEMAFFLVWALFRGQQTWKS